MTLWLSAFFMAFCVAVAATWIMIRVRIADTPDAARKMHAKVTPTSGGIGIIAGTLAGLGFLAFRAALPEDHVLIGCLLLSCLGGLLGLLDDILVLGAKRKLAFMVAITIAFVVYFARIEELALTPKISLHLGLILGAIGTVFWLLVTVNTVNFMDGANGLSMGSCAIGILCLAGLVGTAGHNDVALLGWVACAACLGFLVWNAFTGSIFAGDSGALFVGLLCGSFGVWAVTLGVYPLSVALCFLPLLVDVILTVILRLVRRQNVLEAHNEHGYQRLIRAGLSHLGAARYYWLRCLFCGISAIVAQHKGGDWPLLIFIGFTVVLCLNQLQIRHQATKAIAQNAVTPT